MLMGEWKANFLGENGIKLVSGTLRDKYLYNIYAYDSPLKKDDIKANIEEVIVYRKNPRSGITIPTIASDMYSLDFMHVVKNTNWDKELKIIVETKMLRISLTLEKQKKQKKIALECSLIC